MMLPRYLYLTDVECMKLKGDTQKAVTAIILNDPNQQKPERIKLTTCEEKTSESGKVYAFATAVDQYDQCYTVSFFERDAKACKQQWGEDTDNWEWITFKLNMSGTRHAMVPAKVLIKEEVV